MESRWDHRPVHLCVLLLFAHTRSVYVCLDSKAASDMHASNEKASQYH